jgi:hypothetical protein
MDAQGTEPTATAYRGLLIGGVVLLTAGSVLVFTGALVTGGVAVRATRRWIQQWEEPPRVATRRRLGQARSAVSAGARGWRENGTSSSRATSGAES